MWISSFVKETISAAGGRDGAPSSHAGCSTSIGTATIPERACLTLPVNDTVTVLHVGFFTGFHVSGSARPFSSQILIASRFFSLKKGFAASEISPRRVESENDSYRDPVHR